MKWFKHDTDASEDVRIIRLEEKYGNDGYTVFFKCLEIVGKEGVGGKISFNKFPKNLVCRKTHLELERLDEILQFMATIHLCCSKSLKRQVLYFPKFKSRSDDYTKRVQRKFGQCSDNVPLEKKRKDKIRKEYITRVSEFYVFTKSFVREQLDNDDWVRIQAATARLITKAGAVEKAIQAIEWQSSQEYPWTLETVVKKYPEFLITIKSDAVNKLEEEMMNGEKTGHSEVSKERVAEA